MLDTSGRIVIGKVVVCAGGTACTVCEGVCEFAGRAQGNAGVVLGLAEVSPLCGANRDTGLTAII